MILVLIAIGMILDAGCWILVLIAIGMILDTGKWVLVVDKYYPGF